MFRKNSSNPQPRKESGAVAVEFAFVIVVMLLIVAGLIGFGRTFWYADALTKATRDGARLFSTAAVATIASQGIAQARTITINSANAANVNPLLTTGNVLVECLDDSFVVTTCTNGTAPNNVRVSISGFSVNLSEWFPFIGPDGVKDFGLIFLSPHTTMRYMN